MRNFADKIVWKVTTQISCSVSLLPKYCRLWQNAENCWRARQATDDSTIRRMRFAYWITKATETHWEYVTLVAWPLQQWLHESASILRHSYAACLLLRAQLHANHIEHDVTFYTVLKPVHLPSAVRDITNSDNSLFFFPVCYVLHLTVEPAASLSCWASVATPTMVVMKTAKKFRIPNGVLFNLTRLVRTPNWMRIH